MTPTSIHSASTATDAVTDAVLAAGPDGAAATTQLRVVRHWHAPVDEIELTVHYRCEGSPEAPVLCATIGAGHYRLDDPIRLIPVIIPKPWGREVWFTGLEARGESRVAGDGGELGLGSYLALAPERLCRRHSPVLLKILDPKAEPVTGELYLEVHEEKREVYVVTEVDPTAWPDGIGCIRYGINQTLREQLGSDRAFRQAFLDALNRYEAVRRAVDEGVPGLDAEEAAAREAARAFTGERTLVPGDVVSVPTRVPHSLQHGVRVVEFQTPTYERLILSSSQQVLTQSGWDSARAVETLHLDAPVEPAPESVQPGVDRIASFEDFSVWRARLLPGESLSLPAHLPYAVTYCIQGSVRLAGPHSPLVLSAGQAAFVPSRAVPGPIAADDGALLLVAAPGL